MSYLRWKNFVAMRSMAARFAVHTLASPVWIVPLVASGITGSAQAQRYPARLAHLVCAGALLALASCAWAQRLEPENFVGRKFWYLPSHDKNAPMEFHRSPSFDSPTTRITTKDRLTVMGARRGWLAIHLESLPGTEPQRFMPIRLFRLRIYQPDSVVSAYEAFMQAAIFEEDPDKLAARFNRSDPEQKLKVTGKLPPWQKYKENWSGTKVAQPKKRRPPIVDETLPEVPEPAP